MRDQPRTVALSEIETVRLVCQRKECGLVLEGTLSALAKLRACPACQQQLNDPQVTEPPWPLESLRDVIEAIKKLHTQFDVEFVLPAQEATKTD